MPRQKVDLQEKYRNMSEYENEARSQGFVSVAGMDEAGRGPLAGPVVAAAVILDPENPVYGVDDSKKLSPKKRAALKAEIEAKAISVGVGIVDVETIDSINILEATKLAMKKAVEALDPPPQLLLIDAVRLKDLPIEQQLLLFVKQVDHEHCGSDERAHACDGQGVPVDQLDEQTAAAPHNSDDCEHQSRAGGAG